MGTEKLPGLVEANTETEWESEVAESITEAWTELAENIEAGREATTLVRHEQGDTLSEQGRFTKQLLIGTLGVRDYIVEAYPRQDGTGQLSYNERIITNVPGVEVTLSEHPDGGLWLGLAVNHELANTRLTHPSDIHRVLKTMEALDDWRQSVEKFGAQWNNKREAVAAAELLAIDIDDCIFPSTDRRPADAEKVRDLITKLGELKNLGLKVFLNTGRSAVETMEVLKYFENHNVELDGAVTETGAINVYKTQDNWSIEHNPTVDQEQWDAIALCKQHILKKYVSNGLGDAEPKVSAVTFNIKPGTDVTGHQVIEELRLLLIENGLPTDTVDKADVSDTGLQLFASGIDKAVGMRHLLDVEGVKKEKAIAIGDSAGDIPMFQEVGVTAAPYNAARSLRALTDYYSPYDAESGVNDILGQIIRRKRGKIAV